MGERAKVKPKTTHDLQIETLRPARDAGRDGCPYNRSNVSHCTATALVVVWCGVVCGRRQVHCSAVFRYQPSSRAVASYKSHLAA